MEKLFLILRKSGSPTGPYGLATVMRRARLRIVPGTGPYSVIQDGEVVLANLRRKRALKVLEHRLTICDTGAVVRVRNAEKVVFSTRCVQEAWDVVDTSGNDKADLYWTWVKNTYANYEPRFAGAYVCKDIVGSTTKSQHSYGNAVDVFFDTLAHQHQVYLAVTRGECPVPVANAICENHIWQPADGEDPYGGVKHYHLHVDFAPSQSGSCGVKG